MPISNAPDPMIVWKSIVTTLQAEMNVGPTGPGSGANTGGRLQTVQYVHNTIHLWSDLLPAIGVQLLYEDHKPYDQGVHAVRFAFKIAIAAKSTPDEHGYTTLDNAYAVLMPLLNDRSGNGVVPVLTDPRNPRSARIEGKIEYDWDVDKAVGTTDARAYAYVPYFVDVQAPYQFAR